MTNNNMKVLGIGESVIDKTYTVNGIAEEMPHTLQGKHVGGPVLIAMMLLSRMGAQCTFMTTLGRDIEAEAIENLMEEESIQILPAFHERTKVNSIIVNTQNGSRQKLRGNIIHPNMHGLDSKFLEQFDVIIMDRHEKIAFYEVMLKKRPNTKVIIDPSTEVSNFTMDMIKYADYPILPIEALIKIDANPERALQKLYRHCNRSLIITLGEMGSLVFDGKHTKLIPAVQVQAVDANGAGDIFRGGFAYGVLQGWDLAQSTAFGNLVAGMHCTRLGNATAVPTKQEIETAKETLVTKQITLQQLNNLAI
jgi:sulfofructose kinase